MAENSKIEWCDHTFNPWIGCTKVHSGCLNCYAENEMDKHYHKAKWGPSGTRTMTVPANWAKPLKWNRWAAEGICPKCGGGRKSVECESCDGTGKADGPYRAKVFCASLADVFEEWEGRMVYLNGNTVHRGAPWGVKEPFIGVKDVMIGRSVATMTDVRQELFRVIDSTPNLDWLLLTKRPENIRRMWPEVPRPHVGVFDEPPPVFRKNVWLGTSVSEQPHVVKQIPHLLKCRELSPVLFVSAEPLLGYLSLGSIGEGHEAFNALDGIGGPNLDWVIVGGESGTDARPMNQAWARALLKDCRSSGVPFLFKQWGEFYPANSYAGGDIEHPHGKWSEAGFFDHSDNWNSGDLNPFRQSMIRVGKKAAGRLLDGREWNEFPTLNTNP